MVISTKTICLITWVFLVIFITQSSGLTVPKVEVPRYLMLGESAFLRCVYDLREGTLYSLTWWKDGSQFFQYKPDSPSPYVVFDVPGVKVNSDTLSDKGVEILSVNALTSGQYRCELVGEGPPFTTTFATANLSVIHTPHGPPVIRGLEDLYHDGDTISLTCTSYRSFPPTRLFWSIKQYDQEYRRHQLDGSQRNELAKTKLPKNEIKVISSTTTAKPTSRPKYHFINSESKPSIIPFTYSDHRNRSKSLKRVRRQDWDSILTNFHIQSDQNKKISYKEEQHRVNYFVSPRSTVKFHSKRPIRYHVNHDGAIHYAKGNVFGWKEVKPSEVKDTSLYTNDNAENPIIDSTLDKPFSMDAQTTLQELTLPFSHPSSATATVSTTENDMQDVSHVVAQKNKEQSTNPSNKRSSDVSSSARSGEKNSSKSSRKQVGKSQKLTAAGETRGATHYYAAPGMEDSYVFQKIEDEFTVEHLPVHEDMWSDDTDEDNFSASDLLMPRTLYTSTLSIKLPVSRRMTQRGAITLRCTASVHLYESSTAVQVKVAPRRVTDPHQLPKLLNTGPNPNQVSKAHGSHPSILSLSCLNNMLYWLFWKFTQ